MKLEINYDKNSKIKFTLKAELDKKDLTKQKNLAIKKLGGDAKVPGFRAGTAPVSLVEERINPDALARELTSNCIDVAFSAAIKEFSLDLIGTPKLEIKKYIPEQEMEIEFVGNIKPEIKLPDFSKWAKTKLNVKVPVEEVNKTIEQLRENMAEAVEVTRAAKDGDKVFLDFDGVDEKGEAIPGASSKNYPLVLGSRSFIPGFEEEVIGLKAGDDKEFKITFPKDYHSTSLQSKVVIFTIKIQKVTQLKKPKLDAEFAKKLGDFKSVEELKEDIKKELTQRTELQERAKLKDTLAEKLAKESKFETPDLLIDDNVEAGLANSKRDIASRGQSFEEFLKASGFKDEQEFIQKEVKPVAETQVRVGLSLRALADQEKITVTPQEMQDYTQTLMQQYQNPAAQAQIQSPEEQARIEGRLLADKVLDYLLDKTT